MNADAFRVLRWLNVQATVWCVLLIGPPWLAVAAVTEAWVQRYSGGTSNAPDRAYGVVRDLTEDIIVAGTSDNNATGSDVIIFKYSGKDGALLWQQRYDSLNNSGDAVQALAADRQGNVLVTGFSTRGGNFETADYFTLKYAGRSGELLWEKRYAGPGNKDDIPQALVVDGNGNVVVTGYSVGAANNYDIYTVKYAAADGALLWEKRYNGGASDYGRDNIVVTGYSQNEGNFGFYTAKYAAVDGTLLWERRYNNGAPNQPHHAQAVAVDRNGDVLMTGDSWNAGIIGFYTAKYGGTNGAVLWERRRDGPGNTSNLPHAIALDSKGNAIVTGFSILNRNFTNRNRI